MPPFAASLSNEQRAALAEEVLALLRAADHEIASHQPVCEASGRCCHFETYGHRLYVTTAELLTFAHVHLSPPASPAATSSPTAKDPIHLQQFFQQEKYQGCPYQIGGQCTTRQARPLGCRIYFCDPKSQHWQNDVYEKYHERLKALHEKYGLPYGYVEWRAGLRQLLDDETGN